MSLTDQELKVVEDLGQIWNEICNIVGMEETRQPDLDEAVVHVHALQRMVMANAAGRAHPNRLRCLGETVRDR